MNKTSRLLTLLAVFFFSSTIEASPLGSFESKLLAELQEKSAPSKNIIFSPASIRLAFELARRGAEGETQNELEKVLGLTPERIKMFGEWLRPKKKSAFRLSVANSVWVNQDFKFQKDYLRQVTQELGAEAKSFDAKKSVESSKKINDWVKTKTESRIPELLGPDAIKTETLAVLVNAIYFLADWAQPFKKESTYEGDFRGLKSSKKVKLMSSMDHHEYWEGKGLDVLSLDYMGGEFRMLVVLPSTVVDLKNVGPALLDGALKLTTKDSKTGKVQLELPRFEARVRPEGLKEALVSLGLKKSFSGDAKFVKMLDSVKGDFFVSDVVHEAFVKVDEKGTEAAAATAVLMLGSGMPAQEPEPKMFKVDRPFLFVIEERKTREILFVGSMAEI